MRELTFWQMFLKFILTIGFGYSALYAIGYLFIMYFVSAYPDEYKYDFIISEDSSHWQFKSMTNLFLWMIINFVFYALVSSINFFAILKWKKGLMYSAIILDLAIVFLAIRYHYLYQLSGYDHYPGFDPYIL
jgi:hypothetical protein